MQNDSSNESVKRRGAAPARRRPGAGQAAPLAGEATVTRGMSPDQVRAAAGAVRADWVADTLRQRVIDGFYKPGDRIREGALQEEFGLSNGPAREALQQIVADGLAERAPWRGVRVVELDEAQIRELFQVRLALLEYAAELAAKSQRVDKARSAEELKRKLSESFQNVDSTNGQQHPSFSGELSNWLFHTAGNSIMQSMWRGVMLRTLPYVNRSIRMSPGRALKKKIDALIDAIVEGDSAAARRNARELTQQTLIDLNLGGEL